MEQQSPGEYSIYEALSFCEALSIYEALAVAAGLAFCATAAIKVFAAGPEDAGSVR